MHRALHQNRFESFDRLAMLGLHDLHSKLLNYGRSSPARDWTAGKVGFYRVPSIWMSVGWCSAPITNAAALRLQALDRTLAAEQGIAAATTSSAKFKPYASPSLGHHSSSMFIHVQHAELLQEWFMQTHAAWFQNQITSVSVSVWRFAALNIS